MIDKKIHMMFFVLFFLISSVMSTFAEEIVVYSARNKLMTKIPFNKFFRGTGISLKVVYGDIGELLERIKKEGENSPADLLLTVDAGSLWQATQAGFFQPVHSDILAKNIPSYFRDPQNHWFGLSKRARIIVYNSQRINPSELATYADLAEPKWKNKLCLRTSKKVYNQSLVAMMISKHGVEKTEKIIKGWVKNLDEEPYDKDSEVIRAIMKGQCDVGIVNHYYLGRAIKRYPDIPVDLFWPNQDEGGGGVYVDIAGAGVMKNARNKESAVKLLEWLSSEKAQNLFADSNMEYPVNPNIKPNPQVQAWGDFKQNTENISHAGKNRDAAINLMQRAGYR